jgi:hypothetical protein
MSHGNGNTATVRAADMMVMPCRDVTLDYDGEPLDLSAERDRLGADHPLVAQHPELFRVAPPAAWGNRSVVDRMVRPDDSRASMSLAEELEIRRRAIASFDSPKSRRPAPTDDDRFWSGVRSLLGHDEHDAQDAEDMRMYDEVDTLRTETMESERLAMSEWLDRP